MDFMNFMNNFDGISFMKIHNIVLISFIILVIYDDIEYLEGIRWNKRETHVIFSKIEK